MKLYSITLTEPERAVVKWALRESIGNNKSIFEDKDMPLLRAALYKLATASAVAEGEAAR